jgi:hypothetical protein
MATSKKVKRLFDHNEKRDGMVPEAADRHHAPTRATDHCAAVIVRGDLH